MEALMPGRSRNLTTRHLLWVVLGFFCCALITFGGVVQAGHMHSDGQALRPDCALCHVAHLVVQPTVSQSLLRTVFVVATLAAAPQLWRTQFFFVFSLFTRPPPAETANA
jgi:hypothetical protein